MADILRRLPFERIIYWLWLMPAMMFLVSILFKEYTDRVKMLRARNKKANIIGVTELVAHVVSRVSGGNVSVFKVVGYFDDHDPPRLGLTKQVPLLGKLSKIGGLL